nr:BPK_HP1_G0058380.mRNA.1.CDS.1 [Saccharomyces cerevisiae]
MGTESLSPVKVIPTKGCPSNGRYIYVGDGKVLPLVLIEQLCFWKIPDETRLTLEVAMNLKATKEMDENAKEEKMERKSNILMNQSTFIFFCEVVMTL